MNSHINWTQYRPGLCKKHEWPFKSTKIKLEMQILSHTSYFSRVQQACVASPSQQKVLLDSGDVHDKNNSVTSDQNLLPHIQNKKASTFSEHFSFVDGE